MLFNLLVKALKEKKELIKRKRERISFKQRTNQPIISALLWKAVCIIFFYDFKIKWKRGTRQRDDLSKIT